MPQPHLSHLAADSLGPAAGVVCFPDVPHKQDRQHGAHEGNEEHHHQDDALDGYDVPHGAGGGGTGAEVLGSSIRMTAEGGGVC